MRTSNYDDLTIDRWRIEPRWRALDIDVHEDAEQNPPLWKDVTTASIVALALWMVAALLLA